MEQQRLDSTEIKIRKATKAHQRYKVDGVAVPSVTTILGLMSKPMLIKWANNLGLQGIDSTKYVDETAKIGSLVHERIEAYLSNFTLDMSDYTPNQVEASHNGFNKFLKWYEENDFQVIATEHQMVSEVYKYGGTCDCYGIKDGKYVLLDFKTGKAIYDEYFVQLAAYVNMLLEEGKSVDKVILLRIGRNEEEGFDFREIDVNDLMGARWEIFLSLLNVYYKKKEIGWS